MGSCRSRQCISENQQENRANRWTSKDTETGKFSGNEYRFGEYFLYASEFKKEEQYVVPTYKNLEEEAVENEIRSRVLNRTKRAAQEILDSMIASCLNNRITQQECFRKYGIRLYARKHKYYNKRYNLNAGQQITLEHLIAVKLYFDNTTFPSELRRTYRGINESEKYEHIKARHANYAHTSRALCEAIYLYGNKLPKGKRVFRGVEKITFAWFDAIFAGPVSTSEHFKTAAMFARGGSVIQLEASENDNMYIYGSAKECGGECNLSSHSDERELLMWTPCLYISDVPYSLYKRQYVKSYVSAMLLFQKIVSGHLLTQEESNKLLNNSVQNTLNALIQWRITGDDDELIQFVKEEETQRREEQMRKKQDEIIKHTSNIKEKTEVIEVAAPPPTRRRSSLTFLNNTRDFGNTGNTENTFGCLSLISSKPKCILSQADLHGKTMFIKSLCGTVFENLFKRTQSFWDNSNINLNRDLRDNIETLFVQTKGCQIFKCNALRWRVKDLESAPDINDHFWAVDEYLKKEIIDKKLLKTFLDCEKIMDCIRAYFSDKIYPVDFLRDWKFNVNYKNKMYTISLLLSLWPNSTRPDNKYYDFRIQIINTDNIKGFDNLKWSFDILCEELDISLHFVDRYAKLYKGCRQHTQIISNDDIIKLINNKKDIVWHMNFRFHHSN